MIFLVVEMLVPERKTTRGRSLRGGEPSSGNGEPVTSAAGERRRKAAMAPAGIAVALLLLIPSVGMASTASALREYNAGKYDQALKDYEKLLQNNKNPDPRLDFNAGMVA